MIQLHANVLSYLAHTFAGTISVAINSIVIIAIELAMFIFVSYPDSRLN